MNRYHRYRFPPEIISHAVWLYHRFSLSFREVEELLAKRGIVVSYETIRQWCRKFGPQYARNLRRRQGRLGDVWHLKEANRQRERQMRRFKSAGQAQRVLSVHRAIQNLFRLGRHHLRSMNYRWLRDRSFKEWSAATAA